MECAGDGTYGAGDPCIQGLGSFGGGDRMREKKSELKFSRSLTNFRDKTLGAGGTMCQHADSLGSRGQKEGWEIGI